MGFEGNLKGRLRHLGTYTPGYRNLKRANAKKKRGIEQGLRFRTEEAETLGSMRK